MQNDILIKLETYIAANILKQPGRNIPAQEQIISSGMIDSFSLVDLARCSWKIALVCASMIRS
jgi:hypothetical protein